MSGIVVYSEYEAKRNEFAVSKFKKYLGAELVTAENLQISAKHDFVINRTNNAKTAAEFENIGVRVFNPSPLTALANDKQACYEFMQSNGIEIMPVNQNAAPVVEKPDSTTFCYESQYWNHIFHTIAIIIRFYL